MLPSLLRQFYFIFKAQEDKSKKRFPFPASPLLPSSTLAVRYFKPDWFPQYCRYLPPLPHHHRLNFLISVLWCEDNSHWRGCFHRLQLQDWRQPSANLFKHCVTQQTTDNNMLWGVRSWGLLHVMELAGQHLVLTPSCLASGQWGTPAQPLSDSSLTQPGEYHVLHCMTSHAGPPQSRSLFNEAKTE